MDLPDAELVTRCRSGDQAAWEALVDRFERYVHAIVTRGFGLSGADAEDAFQDVFTRVYERLGDLRDPASLRPWIAQTTRRCCVDRLRARTSDSLDDIAEPAADDLLEELDAALDIRAALAGLSPECGEILDRFFARDESYRTIGEALGLPGGTIASRISRCLEKLRSAVMEQEGKKAGGTPVG
jgi:RNA polymerase sigma factor (sigma-70 family)